MRYAIYETRMFAPPTSARLQGAELYTSYGKRLGTVWTTSRGSRGIGWDKRRLCQCRE